MSKRVKFSNPALQKKALPQKSEQFNLVTRANSFDAVFDMQDLHDEEVRRLEAILRGRSLDEGISQEEDEKNVMVIKRITSEIKSISRQGAFLVGERIVKVRTLLKNYRDGTFTLWLESTFGSRKSGYNMLAYYELFTSLPDDDLRSKYKMMSQKAAYHLANRKGDLQDKLEIIDQHYHLKSDALIAIVQKQFSNQDGRSRRSIDCLLSKLIEVIDFLRDKKDDLSKKDIENLKCAQLQLTKIINHT